MYNYLHATQSLTNEHGDAHTLARIILAPRESGGNSFLAD
jgi:hypothetical protein